MTAILVKNALVVTLDPAGTILPNGQILIEGSKISAVGAQIKAEFEVYRQVVAAQKLSID